jgi:hypothetical protein
MKLLATKWGTAAETVAAVALAGTIATASAHHSERSNPVFGYSLDQCKDGGWKNFQNPDGSQKFKNQGDCVSYFARSGAGEGIARSDDFEGAFWDNANRLFESVMSWFSHRF